ncbi:dTDP-glucose 4,6-dehydratase [Terribacillus aidingensis]|uniref:dTDP-glucose 4,6-dehydratase n=1 Tax=Terribacillus aidingensis TaxID=586416 RepID=A0A285N5R0_9BACI|nr:dTDP-glucose 4,6-dehydratase [Terribacillus aidingensis]SNZ04782.1 dTDP-glucose 4,6-dehydratase [Terribacillus aidingensis]
MNRTKILVTGGAGFIGGNYVHYLLNNDPDALVYNLDSLTYAGELNKHERCASNPNYKFIEADIRDKEQITNIFEEYKFDYVVHFAAESHVDRSIHSPDVFLETNVLGTHNLLNASLKTNIKKFLHVSTDEVYGELDFTPNTYFNEDTPLDPSSPYSSSKASSDLIVLAYSKTYGLPVNITRCSNNYGPFHFPEKLIPLAITNVLRNRKVPVYGTGENIRDWLHVEDHCSAIDLVLRRGENGQVYNIGGHNEKTNLEVVSDILSYFGKSLDCIEYVKDRKGHDKRYAINPSKISELGWKPNYQFKDGLKQTIEWYVNNRSWWERLLTEDK